MANVCILAASTSDNTVTRVGSALTAVGHTYTAVDDANIGSTDFSSYDVLLVVRNDSALEGAVAAFMMDWVKAGKALIFCDKDNSANSTTNGLILIGQVAGFSTNATDQQNGTTLGGIVPTAAGEAHSILSGYTAGTSYATKTAATDSIQALKSPSGNGSVLANGHLGNVGNDPVVIAWETGSELVNGVICKKRVVYLGYLNAVNNDFSTTGQEIIQRSVTWVTGAAAYDEAKEVVSAAKAYVVVEDPQDRPIVDGVKAYVVIEDPTNEVQLYEFKTYLVIEDGPVSANRRAVQNVNYH